MIKAAHLKKFVIEQVKKKDQSFYGKYIKTHVDYISQIGMSTYDTIYRCGTSFGEFVVN